jgi:hypothetical protein
MRNHMINLEIPSEMTTSKLVYSLILQFMQDVASEFSLIVQPRLRLDPSGEGLLSEFLPFQRFCGEVDRWPGTILLKGKVTIYQYSYNQQARLILNKYSSTFSDWIQPLLPEDIAFYRSNSSVLLGSISHESSVMFYLENCEQKEMKDKYPELYKLLF